VVVIVTESRQRRWIGWLLVGLAGLIVYFAFTDPKVYTQQRWLMILAAGIFSLVGLQLITAAKGRLSALMGGLVCAGLSSLGFVAAFSHKPLQGGIPFIPAAWNQMLGHGLFGSGAVLTAAMALFFFVRAIKPGKSE
jgi:hypothetical protein